jgi:hypothetical protein
VSLNWDESTSNLIRGQFFILALGRRKKTVVSQKKLASERKCLFKVSEPYMVTLVIHIPIFNKWYMAMLVVRYGL